MSAQPSSRSPGPGPTSIGPSATPHEAADEPPPKHRKRTARQVRRRARTQLHVVTLDGEAMEDADLACPLPHHDLGRKPSRPPKHQPKPGHRSGFKVWKTPFWKRRNQLRAERNAAERRLARED